MSSDEGEVSRFDAENATAQTLEFLKRLGYRENWLPMKVSMDGDLYIVEMAYQQMSAKVQINSKTKEVKEYEFQKGEAEKKSFLNSRMFLFVVVGASAAIILLQFLGVF